MPVVVRKSCSRAASSSRPADDGSEQHVVVSREVLRRAVEDEVGAVLERTQMNRRRRGRVARREALRERRRLRGRAWSGRDSTGPRARRAARRRAPVQSGRTRRSSVPNVRGSRKADRFRSTRPPRARLSHRARATRARARSSPRHRTETAARAPRRAHPARPRPRHRPDVRSAGSRTRRAHLLRRARSSSGRGRPRRR